MSERNREERKIERADINATRDAANPATEATEVDQARAAPRIAPPIDVEDIDTGPGGMVKFDPAADPGTAGGLGQGLGETREAEGGSVSG